MRATPLPLILMFRRICLYIGILASTPTAYLFSRPTPTCNQPLDSSWLQVGVGLEKRYAVGVDANMPIYRHIRRNIKINGKGVARIGYWRTAEIKRTTLLIQHYFDDIGIEHGLFVMDRMASGGKRSLGMLRQIVGDFLNMLRCYQRLIALHIHHNFIAIPTQFSCHLGYAVGTGSMISTGHYRLLPMLPHDISNSSMVGRYIDTFGATRCRLLRDPNHHGLASDIQQRLARQTGRGIARRDDNLKAHDIKPLPPASPEYHLSPDSPDDRGDRSVPARLSRAGTDLSPLSSGLSGER